MPAASRFPDGRTTPRAATVPVAGKAAAASRPAGSPAERRRVRRTRIWMLLLLLTPVCLAGISLLAFATSGPPEPTVHARAVPSGYYAVTDADFGYAVPNAYQQNTSWTDQNGDFLYGDPKAFVAETLLVADTPPTAGSRPPASLASFGQPTPLPYSLGDGHPIAVPGTSYAYEETMTRPGGYQAVIVDTWERSSSTQMWLMLHSPAPVTRTVIASLQG
jgi:hypothetical protein